ncbi:hypothetical protein [Streptococcus moroccensis]|uniref:Cell division protein ZapA (FtsZ GTPase activity inhibitor) n=1 Tax=Streptococcus moroccensis TaxID=1451356 RepID=A0ABT9YRP2_9STRE|nr:hypothetical protein [Streptococcus moroccensis]MDQ0222277.1 cell division protein ZapA (FtsZ GTPase activity inhibitor) [Streptococcus moroccensis]
MNSKFTLNVELSNLDKLKDLANDVLQKAEELEQAVQRLNEVELGLKTKTIGQ